MTDMNARLKQARVAAGFKSASKAADSMGIRVSTYSSHENGQNNYSVDDAIRYGKKYKVDPVWLVFGVGDHSNDYVHVDVISMVVRELHTHGFLGKGDPETAEGMFFEMCEAAKADIEHAKNKKERISNIVNALKDNAAAPNGQFKSQKVS